MMRLARLSQWLGPVERALSLSRSKALLSAAIGAALLSAGCADIETGTDLEQRSCGGGAHQSFVISTLGFTRVNPEDGTAPGFNVDGVVSDSSDEGSCFKQDFFDPDGNSGIDNQLAVLVPDVENLLGDAVDGLVQGAINNGDLIILLDVEGAANRQNDDCVDLTVTTGLGKPTLGTDGTIEGYQTFDLDPEGEVSTARSGKIENGILTAGPFELAIPIAIFDVAFTIHVHNALFRLRVDAEDGTIKEGVLGGGIVPQEILDGVREGAGVEQYIPVLSLVLKGNTDLAQDAEGVCQQVSAALNITAVDAFIRP